MQVLRISTSQTGPSFLLAHDDGQPFAHLTGAQLLALEQTIADALDAPPHTTGVTPMSTKHIPGQPKTPAAPAPTDRPGQPSSTASPAPGFATRPGQPGTKP